MRRILVVCYSRTGYTRTLARTTAAAVKAVVETLDDGRERRGVWGYLRCAREAFNTRGIEIQPAAYDQRLQGFVDVIAGGSAGKALCTAAARRRANGVRPRVP
jgi:hypothetical protein